jgi:hypothetical protein
MGGLTVHLIGGGESARALDTASLYGLRIGLNDAGFEKPCDAWFSLDHNYARGKLAEFRTADLIERFPEGVHVCARYRDWGHFPRPLPVQMWGRVPNDKPTLVQGEISVPTPAGVGCTGHAALNLAVQLGADRVYLWGYDFHDEYRYFFADEPFPRLRVPQVRATFELVAPWYAARDIRIFNTNSASSIKAFPHGTP